MSSTQNITLLNVDHKAIARVDVRGTGELSLPSPPSLCRPGIAPRELFCLGLQTLPLRPPSPSRPCPSAPARVRARPPPPPPPTPPGSSRMFNWVDYDGSATLRSTPTIVGSWPSWWNLAPDCSYEVRSGCGLGGRASKLESCIQ
jgi:hypothetical protein